MEDKDKKILLEKPYSDHAEDKHLSLVLALYKDKEYVTWIKNTSIGTFSLGHYFGNNQEAAIQDYLKRGFSFEKINVNEIIRDKIQAYIQDDLDCPESEAEQIAHDIFKKILLEFNK